MAFLYKTSSFCTFFIISSAETLRFLKAGHKYVIFQGGCAVLVILIMFYLYSEGRHGKQH